MGLDMYLYRREYLSGWDHSFADDKPNRHDILKSLEEYFDHEVTKDAPHAYIDMCVAYWRKANAIHGWIVDNCAGGVDECQPIRMSTEKVLELRDLAKSVIEQPAMAASVLPTQQGFFFGSYDYDEWYMQDMKNTVDQLDKALAGSSDFADFIYQASW